MARDPWERTCDGCGEALATGGATDELHSCDRCKTACYLCPRCRQERRCRRCGRGTLQSVYERMLRPRADGSWTFGQVCLAPARAWRR